MIGSAWRSALLAAVAVEVAAGLLASAAASRILPGDEAMILFVTCTAAAGLADMVVIPGWVWAPGTPAILPLLLRCGSVVLALGFAACAGVAVAFVGFATWLAIVPGVGQIGFVACFAVAGAVAGLGAWLGEAVDRRNGLVRGRRSSHVIAGVVGSLAVLGASAIVTWCTAPLDGSTFRPVPWPIWGLGPAALALGGGLHHGLLAGDGRRAGRAPPAARTVTVRATVFCAACLAVAGAVMVLA